MFMYLHHITTKHDALRKQFLVCTPFLCSLECMCAFFYMEFYVSLIIIVTWAGIFPVTVYGAFLPRHIFYCLHAVCAYLRCIFVALCVLFLYPSFDIILVDQVSVVIPLMKLKKLSKVKDHLK